MDLLIEAISHLQNHGQTYGQLSDEQWLMEVKQFLLPADHFVAGFIATRLPIWQKFFDHFGWTAKAHEIIDWLMKGLAVRWVPVIAESQQQHPRYEHRLQLVRALLARTVGKKNVGSLIGGSEPHQVHFWNAPSVQQHYRFVKEQIEGLISIRS